MPNNRCLLCGHRLDDGSSAVDWHTETWPRGLEEIADIIGPELTLRLAEAHGGVDKFYIPRSVATNHPWAETIGAEAWGKLCRAIGGQRINLPRGEHLALKKLQILELAESTDLSHRAIALRVRATEAYVRMVLRELKDDRQGSLF